MQETETLQTHRVAFSLRFLIWATGGFFLGMTLVTLPNPMLSILGTAIFFCSIVLGLFAAVTISRRVWGVMAAILIALASLFPLGILFSFLVSGIAAGRYLKKKGIRVGVFGVSSKEFNRLQPAVPAT